MFLIYNISNVLILSQIHNLTFLWLMHPLFFTYIEYITLKIRASYNYTNHRRLLFYNLDAFYIPGVRFKFTEPSYGRRTFISSAKNSAPVNNTSSL